MQALKIQKHGAKYLQIADVPKPAPKPSEVLVRIEAAGINPSDLAGVQGKFPNAVLPRIPGRDFAGQVEKGVYHLSGAPVWGTGGDLGITRDGTHAEYIVLPQDAVARRPETLTAEQAAAAGVPFITAYSALIRLGEVKPGEWVIVAGAAGAVGQAAIQIAHAKHAHVIALVRDTKDNWVSKSPAVGAVAYSERNDLPTVVRALTAGKGASLALNGVGATVFGAIMQSLKIGGRQIIYSIAGGRDFNLDLQYIYRNDLSIVGLGTEKLNATQCAAILNELAPMFASGTLKPPRVDGRYPLSKSLEAYARVATGGNGKVVLLMPQQDSVADATPKK